MTQVSTIVELSPSERFTAEVMKQFSSNNGEVNLSNYQKKLIQNYFIKLDASLKDAEKKRLAKAEKNREPLEFSWKNINMQKLAVDVVVFSSVGLDPTQPNHINLIPYKNGNTNKYDITFMLGYKGIELKAKKYGFNVPDDIIIELVYSTDEFKSIKKDITNRIEGYNFTITNDFDRGEIIGGFYYHIYFDKPEKNKLKCFSMKDIEKRIPKYASAEFWGGEKDLWVDGKKAGTEKVEGWRDEMCFKTIYRSAYSAITIDSEKIDEKYLEMIKADREFDSDDKVKATIELSANKQELPFDSHEVVVEPKVITTIEVQEPLEIKF